MALPSSGQSQVPKTPKITSFRCKRLTSLLSADDWPKHGCLIGATEAKGQPKISAITKIQRQFVKIFNAALQKAVGSAYTPWSTLFVTRSGNVKIPKDITNASIMLFGKFAEGAVHLDDDSKTIDATNVGQLHSFDCSKRLHTSTPTGTRFTVIIFHHASANRLSMDQWQTLTDLGYRLHWSCRPQEAYEYNLWSNGGYKTPITVPNNKYNRRLVEIFCGHNSVLGRYTKHSSSCDIVRITEELDMYKPSTHDIAVDANTCVWISAPCKGGSRWNQRNWHCLPSVRPRILELVQEFVMFLNVVIRILRRVFERGYKPIVCFELPSHCAYWHMILVQDFIDEFGLSCVRFD